MFNIQPQVFSVDEYVSSIQPPERAQAVRDLLGVGDLIFAALNGPYNKSGCAVPVIRVTDETHVNAEGIEGVVRVTVGLIDHCLDLKAPALGDILPGVAMTGERLVPKTAMAWVLGHEFLHVLRRHGAALEGSSDPAHQYATEYDADLCSAAAIFRLNQRAAPPNADDTLSRLVSGFFLFWAVRTLPATADSNTHSPIGQRWVAILMKLAMVADVSGEAGDNDCDQPVTLERGTALMDLTIRCEDWFMKSQGKTGFRDSDFLPAMMADVNALLAGASGPGSIGQTMAGWESIKARVEEVSRTYTGNLDPGVA